MDIYERLNQIMDCTDVLDYARKLLAFAQAARGEKNRAAIVKAFYERLTRSSLPLLFDQTFSDQHYEIYDGSLAVRLFMALSVPGQETPVKSLVNLEAFAGQVLKEFMPPAGRTIEKASLLQYLDEEYAFSSRVFSDRKALFCILNTSNRQYNAHCVIRKNGEKSFPISFSIA